MAGTRFVGVALVGVTRMPTMSHSWLRVGPTNTLKCRVCSVNVPAAPAGVPPTVATRAGTASAEVASEAIRARRARRRMDGLLGRFPSSTSAPPLSYSRVTYAQDLGRSSGEPEELVRRG